MKVLVLGAGQLARMMALAGAPLNIEVLAYDVGTGRIVHPLTQQIMLKGLDTAITYANVITAEFEHIPHDILDTCQRSGKFLPSSEAIKAGGDRRLVGHPTPAPGPEARGESGRLEPHPAGNGGGGGRAVCACRKPRHSDQHLPGQPPGIGALRSR